MARNRKKKKTNRKAKKTKYEEQLIVELLCSIMKATKYRVSLFLKHGRKMVFHVVSHVYSKRFEKIPQNTNIKKLKIRTLMFIHFQIKSSGSQDINTPQV